MNPASFQPARLCRMTAAVTPHFLRAEGTALECKSPLRSFDRLLLARRGRGRRTRPYQRASTSLKHLKISFPLFPKSGRRVGSGSMNPASFQPARLCRMTAAVTPHFLRAEGTALECKSQLRSFDKLALARGGRGRRTRPYQRCRVTSARHPKILRIRIRSYVRRRPRGTVVYAMFRLLYTRNGWGRI